MSCDVQTCPRHPKFCGYHARMTCNRMHVEDNEVRELREVLAEMLGAAKNEMVARGLPLEWSADSPMGRAAALLAIDPGEPDEQVGR